MCLDTKIMLKFNLGANLLNRQRKIGIMPVLIATLLLCFLLQVNVGAKDDNLISKFAKDDIDAAADHMEFVGGNMIGQGHVVVKYKDITINCDKAVINMESKDAELTGNVVFIRRTVSTEELEKWQFEEYQKDTNKKLTVQGYINKPSGRRVILVSVISEDATWNGERAVGNLASGIFDLGGFEGKYDNFFYLGKHAEREPGGVMKVTDATLSTCEFLLEGHEHYSITASRVKFIPTKNVATNESKNAGDISRYDVWAYNCTFWIGSVPVFWSPVLFKSSDERGLGWQVQGGYDSNWGYYVKTKKTVKLNDDPEIHASLLADYFSDRGPGTGLMMKIRSEKSYTKAMVYGMLDSDAEKTEHTRFDIPKERYDAYLEHYWHITPRLDIRGKIEKISDINFLYDFFEERYNNDPQPATYANFDYQFDRFIVSGTVRPRINDFFSEVERLPELRLDIPRQELFSNIYYQGETSIANMKMRWRDYDVARSAGNLVDPKDYDSTRFDTLHMFYYPLNFNWINLIPRSGIRLSYYSDTSKGKISPASLDTLYGVDNFGQGDQGGSVVNYDSLGSEKWRFIYEGGLEANTKFSRAWTNTKNAFWDIDGIRHVIVPYANYNFIPNPSLDRDKIYHFDDIDRINRQNFVRLGVQNRLETRRGDWDKQAIYTWATMENYMDYHFVREKKINGEKFPNIGDFGTKFTFTPISDFSFSNDLLIDPDDFSINKYSASLEYDITDRWKLHTSYNYQSEYDQRSIYSMGSSLTDITSGSSFIRRFYKYQTVQFGLEFPIRESTRGEFEVDYDLEEKMISESKIKLIQNLHCWEVALEYGLKQRNSSTGNKENQHKVMIMFYLTAAPGVKIQAKQNRSTGGETNDESSSTN